MTLRQILNDESEETKDKKDSIKLVIPNENPSKMDKEKNEIASIGSVVTHE